MEEAETSRRLSYQPALDGLRAVALLGVLAYHAGIDAMRGGFLGVSSFFTLSGFLITSLLLVEHIESGRVELGSFWVRRLGRLFPAALVAITVTVLVAAVLADNSQLDRLRADALASLFHFSNWRFIAESDSYGALFESPSVFRHFWSLAVEEQYYLVFPLAIVGALQVFGGPTRRFVVAVGFVSLIAMVWPAFLLAGGASSDRLYFGTDTRLGELIVGSLLALWWVRRGQEVPDAPRRQTAVGLVAVVVLGWMWATAHPDDDFLYRGGLGLHAILTLTVIMAAIAPRGLIRRVLSAEPLRRLGVISYGAYIIHWPVLLWLQQHTSLGPEARFVVGLVVTMGLASVSHRFVERPIRQLPTGPAHRRVWLAIPASITVAAVVLAITAWRVPTTEPIDFAAAESTLGELIADEPAPATVDSIAKTASPEDLDNAVRLTGFGDSTALMTGLGITRWAEDHPDELTVVLGHVKLGCGLVTGGARRVEGRVGAVSDECDTWLADWVDAIRGKDVDIALVQLGAWEIFDHQVEPGGPFLAIGRDEEFDAMLRDRLGAAVTSLHEHSDVVAIVANPDVGQARLDNVPVGTSYPEHDPDRSARWRELVEEIAAANPDTIVIDLASWIHGRDDDRRLRPDGVHFSAETTEEVAEWLAPEILAEYRALKARRANSTATTKPVTRRVLLVGDSVMAETAPATLAAFATAAEPVQARFESLPALPRTEDEVAEWQMLVTSFDPDVVIVYVGFWETAAAGLAVPAVGEAGFEDVYRETVLAPWFDHLREIGVQTIFLGMAPVGDPDWNDLIQVTVAAAEAEAADRDDVDFVPTAIALAPNGYADVLPDPRSGVDERARRIDGLHLCPDGTERVADLLLERLERLVALAISDEWRVGPWRTDTPFDLSVECPHLD